MKIPEIIEKLRVLAPVDWNEETTKLRAVVPILNALGWSSLDMDFEVWIGRGEKKYKLDIQLFTSNHPVIIECKKPAIDLDRAVGQMVDYAYHEGARLAALTNGFRWDLYLPYTAKGRPRESRFASIDLLSDSTPSALCDELMLFLERNAVESGKALSSAEERLEVKRRGEQIQDALPAVWHGMLATPPDTLLNLIADEVRQRIGHNPTNHQVREFLSKHGALTTEPMPSTPAEQYQRHEPIRQHYSSPGRQPKKPIRAFSLWNQRTEVATWASLLFEVAVMVYRRHRSDFARVTNEVNWIARSDSRMLTPRRIPNSPYYINIHGGAPGLERRARQLLNIFGYSPLDLTIDSSDSIAQHIRHESRAQKTFSVDTDRASAASISAFVLWGQRAAVTSWVELLIGVTTIVYQQHGNDLDHMTKKVSWISRNHNILKKPNAIPGSPFYVNSYAGAKVLEARCRSLLKFFGHSPDDLQIIE